LKPGPRALIAYAAGKLLSDSTGSSLYDYSQGTYRNISGTVSASRINLYDYTDSCHLSGNGTGGSHYSLYHYGEGSHITLNTNGSNFSGYDYASGDHFSGHVTGRSITLYDYGEGKYFSYTV
jgi:hypothetical protein